MAAHMDILRHLVKNTEHKPDARAFGADGEENACGGQSDRKPVAAGFWAGILFAAA